MFRKIGRLRQEVYGLTSALALVRTQQRRTTRVGRKYIMYYARWKYIQMVHRSLSCKKRSTVRAIKMWRMEKEREVPYSLVMSNSRR